jgi:multidrug efflux pump subunit AcrA (membrane-fusion protein)
MRLTTWLIPGLVSIPLAFSASAQVPTGPTLGTPVEADAPAALPADKQEMIRRHAAHADLPTADLAEPPRVGTVIPGEVALLSMPQDGQTVTPSVTSYNYVIAGDVIAIVDPESRKVLQLIER